MGDWEKLSAEQMSYLVQVRPPGDTITMVIRNIVEENNITNAAIIFDDSFGICTNELYLFKNT